MVKQVKTSLPQRPSTLSTPPCLRFVRAGKERALRQAKPSRSKVATAPPYLQNLETIEPRLVQTKRSRSARPGSFARQTEPSSMFDCIGNKTALWCARLLSETETPCYKQAGMSPDSRQYVSQIGIYSFGLSLRKICPYACCTVTRLPVVALWRTFEPLSKAGS